MKKHCKEGPNILPPPLAPREPRHCMRMLYVPYRRVGISVTLCLLTLVSLRWPRRTLPLVRGLSVHIISSTARYHQSIIRGINSATTANNPDSAQDGCRLPHFLPYVQAKGRQGSHWLKASTKEEEAHWKTLPSKAFCVTERTEASQGDDSFVGFCG